MLEVKKSGSTKYGFWAYGTLQYQGLTIRDLFSVNEELKSGETYNVSEVNIYRTKNKNLIFRLNI